MRLFLVSFLLTSFFSQALLSDWLCREASSQKLGQIITACGIGKSEKLDEARVKSRESAVEEFKRICQLSNDCFDFDYTVTPKRTDCELKDGLHICYRALDFEITEQKRKLVSLNLSDLESELNQKEAEIKEIQNRIEKLDQIKKTDALADQKKKELALLEASLNQKEAEALKLEDLNSKDTIESGGYKYLHQIYKSSFKFSFHYWDSKISDSSEKDIMWLASYERRPYSWLGMQFYGGFANGRLNNQKSSVADVPTMGLSNSIHNYNGKVVLANLGLAGLVYPGWSGTYLKMELGLVAGRKESYTINYNGAGVGTATTDTTNVSATYYGAQVGFDTRDDKKGWGMFSEIGFRKINSDSDLGMIGGLGLNYGF